METRIHFFLTTWMILWLVLITAFPSSADTVIDQLGRSVNLPSNPQRIIALAPNITEIMFALGLEHRLVGATRFSDYPTAAQNLPKVGSYVYLDLEKIVGLKPDLCIAIKDGNPKAVVDRLEALNIPVYAVDPRNLESVIETVSEMGKLLGAQETAERLKANLQSRIERVEHLLSQTGHRPRVFFQIGISPIVSVGTNTFIHGLIELAGGRNLAEGSMAYPRFSREQVMAFSPDVMIISSMARIDAFDRVKAEWSQWQDIPAVRDQRIFLVDSNRFDRPTPRLVDALEILVRLIHPELFEPGMSGTELPRTESSKTESVGATE